MIKTGPHYLPGGEADTQDWMSRAQPTVAKFCYRYDIAVAALPGTLKLGRPDENFIGGNWPIGEGDPKAAAAKMVEMYYQPLISVYPFIDLWEGPNEINCNPGEEQRMIWYSEFLAELGRLIFLLGKRAALGAWATGTPELVMWQYYKPVLQACKQYNAVLTRHGYGPLDDWNMYRYRRDEAEFNKLGLYNTPLIISEWGADKLQGFPGTFREVWGTNAQGYWNDYLRKAELEMQKDVYVIGATVFTVGTGFSPAWIKFDVSGCGMTNAILSNPVPPVPPVPTLKVTSLPEADHWVLIFTSPSDPAPKPRKVTWDMDVSTKLTVGAVTWLKVNNSPEMWVMAAQTKAK